MSAQNDRDETQRIEATDRTPSRRRILLGSTTLAAISALGAGAPMQFAQAQTPPSPSKPNILAIDGLE